VRDILPVYQPTIVDDLQHAFLQLEALRRGVESDGFLAANPHILTAAVCSLMAAGHLALRI
jgi:hypothetical protein